MVSRAVRHQSDVEPAVVGERSESELLSRYSTLDLRGGDGHFTAEVGNGARQELSQHREALLHVFESISIFLIFVHALELVVVTEVLTAHRVASSFIWEMCKPLARSAASSLSTRARLIASRLVRSEAYNLRPRMLRGMR